MFGWVATPAAFAYCDSTLIVDYSGPQDVLEWPDDRTATPDSIFVVQRSGLGSVGALSILDPLGVEVSVTRIDVAEQWTVLVPSAPLAIGEDYELVTEDLYSPTTFDVVDESAGDLEAPLVPARRSTFSEVLRLDENCPDEAYVVDEVHYRMCGRSALIVALVGEMQPAVPTSIADLGVVTGAGTGDELVLVDTFSPGDSTTVWLGSFDGVGRFRGWVADAITIPDAGTIRLEQPAGHTGGETTTPTVITDCPTAPVSWVAAFEETCASWEPTGLECNEEEDADGSDVCGCTSGVGGAWGVAPLLAALVARRRRAGA
jgi:hypothetical protein